jgi:hypothetical protein
MLVAPPSEATVILSRFPAVKEVEVVASEVPLVERVLTAFTYVADIYDRLILG